ncbi:hypothetical protein CONPUDRAFT_169446 [Coniophora puteana RWD-64-598 SS2]|uniref:Uncharacterized protein n=1 Tax=Coniophora puteana (strain RWD-64-598) TaxID=741705 RepID=A0A5M3M9T0_CONPW|nr:uncharacterized protein CONPUDRAFT_169446 [Coniophora puteana RWD-64-598 SS2]EIW75696.1 hypothetical protein CONPUDRAFT_169446 [Coniophora puteana RWD-64-598 SS2]
MRSFITLAVLYATLAAAAPLPPPLSDLPLVGAVAPALGGLAARQDGDLPIPLPIPIPELPLPLPIPDASNLKLRQLDEVTGAASGLKQKIDQTAASTGVSARQVTDPLGDLRAFGDLHLRQLGGATDALGNVANDVGSTLGGVGSLLGSLLAPFPAPAPPAAPAPGLGKRQGDPGLGSVSGDLNSLLSRLGLRQLGDVTDELSSAEQTVDKAAAGVDAKLARRQDDEGLEEIVEDVDSMVGDLGKRQAPTDEVLEEIVEDAEGLLNERQNPGAIISDIDSLIADITALSGDSSQLKRQDGSVADIIDIVSDAVAQANDITALRSREIQPSAAEVEKLAQALSSGTKGLDARQGPLPGLLSELEAVLGEIPEGTSL